MIIPQALIEAYKKEEPIFHFYAVTLNKYSVVGFELQKDMDKLMEWLNKNKIPFERNNRFLIWLDSLEPSIKKVLRS